MGEKSLKISLFYCANNLNANKLSESVELNKKFVLKPISLACSGRINIQYYLKAIETGSDAIVLVTCPQETCHFIEGNLRAKKRVIAVNSILRESGFEDDRVKIISPNIDDSAEKIIQEIISTCNTLIKIPQEEI